MGVTSIWNNDFYNSSPIPKWSWELDFSSFFLINDEEKKESYASKLNKAAVSCQWGGRTGNLIPVYYAGIEAKLPGRTSTAGELTIKFNENIYMGVTHVLEDTFHDEITCDGYYSGQSGYAAKDEFNKVNRKIILKIHKPAEYMMHNSNDSRYQNEVLCTITYHNCILYKIDPVDLSYEEEDGVISHNVTFSYDYMTIVGNPDASTSVNFHCPDNMSKVSR